MGRVGADLIEAFEEMAADIRGEVRAASYEVPADVLETSRIPVFRRRPVRKPDH
jgi:hypothetical protein